KAVVPVAVNTMPYINPEADKLIDEAERTFDVNKQNEVLARLHEIIVDDAPWIFVVHDQNPRALSPKVKGFVQPQSWFVDLTSVTVRSRRLVWVYVGRRLLLAIPTLLGASIIVFAMVHLAPGDPIAAVMPAESSKAEIEATKRAYGFDKPLPVQYLVWLGRVATGDLGKSLATSPPAPLPLRAPPRNGLWLALSPALPAFGLGAGLGLLAAFWRGRALDKVASGMAVVGVSVPHYWAAITLIIIFPVQLNWLPA